MARVLHTMCVLVCKPFPLHKLSLRHVFISSRIFFVAVALVRECFYTSRKFERRQKCAHKLEVRATMGNGSRRKQRKMKNPYKFSVR